MQRAHSWHSSTLLVGVGGLLVMCVFLTIDFSECALSTSVFISSCLSSCQNLFGHMCFLDFVCLCVCVFMCIWGREKQAERARERGEFLTIRLQCVFFDCVHVLVSGYVTSTCWLTGCCSAFWQTVPLNHAAVVTHSDRTPLPPWDSSIRVSHALNEEVNMLNCLLEMKWRGCLKAACHVRCPHILVPLLEAMYITQWAYTAKSHLCSFNSKCTVPYLHFMRIHNINGNVVCSQQKENELRYVGHA